MCVGQINVVIETSLRREDALRNQGQHTVNFINSAVAKARSPALQTGQLRRKALTLQDVDSSIAKVKKDVKARHDAMMSGQVADASGASGADANTAAGGLRAMRSMPALQAPSMIAGVMTASKPKFAGGSLKAGKSVGAPPVISAARRALAAVAAKPRLGQLEGSSRSTLQVRTEKEAVTVDPATKASPAKGGQRTRVSRAGISSQDSSFKSIDLLKIMSGEAIRTRLNGAKSFERAHQEFT